MTCGIIDFPQSRCREGGAVPPNWRRLPFFPSKPVPSRDGRMFCAQSRVQLSLTALNDLVLPGVTDIFVSARSGVWVTAASGVTQVSARVEETDVRLLASELIDLGGRHIDEAHPCADVVLADGVRVHAVLAGVSTSGTEISIRVPREKPLGLDEFTDAELLATLVAQRTTFVITGSTGSGKTTLLAALMGCAPESDRIITIEDVAELRIQHPRIVSLQARQANYESRGEIRLDDLIRESLRMRPDRLVLGECRGIEVRDALLAFTTGHAGGGTTLHANSPEDALVRLAGLLNLAGLSDATAARLVASSVGAFVHIDRVGELRRLTIARPVLTIDERGRPRLVLEVVDE
mgnify:CR=1 FL=1